MIHQHRSSLEEVHRGRQLEHGWCHGLIHRYAQQDRRKTRRYVWPSQNQTEYSWIIRPRQEQPSPLHRFPRITLHQSTTRPQLTNIITTKIRTKPQQKTKRTRQTLSQEVWLRIGITKRVKRRSKNGDQTIIHLLTRRRCPRRRPYWAEIVRKHNNKEVGKKAKRI